MSSIVDLIDTSNVIDIMTSKPIAHYQLNSTSKILFQHSFHCIELNKHIQLLVTKVCVILYAHNQLLFPSLSIHRVQFRSADNKIQLLIDQKKIFTLELISKQEEYNIWFTPSQHTWLPLKQLVNPKPIKTTDLFSYYHDPTGEISPISDDGEEQVHPFG